MKSYKTELDPNNAQRTACLRAAGASRWAYNFGLRRKQEAWAARKAALAAGTPKDAAPKIPTAIDLHRELNRLKQIPVAQGGVPWMRESSKCAPQESLRNLDRALDGFLRRVKAGQRPGYPRFKSRKRGIGSFTLTGAIRVTDRTIQLPRLGVLRLKERGYFPTDERVVAATVSEQAGRWFVSIRTDADPSRPHGTERLGVDVGVRKLAVCSNGTTFQNPRALRSAEQRMRVLQKAVTRKKRGGANRRKAVRRLARQHFRVHNIRRDAQHKATDAITKRAAVLGLESLHVAGMLKNHRLARSLSDAGLGEVHRQLRYKMAWAGGVVVEADRFYPSSKRCAACGALKADLGFAETYRCTSCGLVRDRDVNAAMNLQQLAASSAVTACRPGSAGPGFDSDETPVWAGTKRHLASGTDG